jgi:hypothetical protein
MLKKTFPCIQVLMIWIAMSLCCLPSRLMAQHCASILESYLSGIALEHDPKRLRLKLEYTKSGGRDHAAYQAILVAFKSNNIDANSDLTPQQAIEKRLAIIVGEQLLERKVRGNYQCEIAFEPQTIVKQLLKDGLLDHSRTVDVASSTEFRDQIGLAVFIPFLADTIYSKDKNLPADRHECNYNQESCLLFQQLPHKLRFRFWKEKASRFEDAKLVIEVNGHRPPLGK